MCHLVTTSLSSPTLGVLPSVLGVLAASLFFSPLGVWGTAFLGDTLLLARGDSTAGWCLGDSSTFFLGDSTTVFLGETLLLGDSSTSSRGVCTLSKRRLQSQGI